MLSSKISLMLGSILFGLLGMFHLILTFFTNKFQSHDKKVMGLMEMANPILSENISIWKAWIGFNASHSSGIIFIAVINCFLVTKHFPLLQKSDFFFLFNIATVAFYVFLAAKYWFAPPLIGTGITLVCYITAYILTKLA